MFKNLLPSLLYTKSYLLTKENENEYVPFVINKALSFHYDCILYANQMNMYSNIDKKLQYDYYINSLRSYKRPFQKWLKPEKIEDLEYIKEYYACSNEKAKEILSILSEDQLNIIIKKLDKGGSNVRHKRIDRSEAN